LGLIDLLPDDWPGRPWLVLVWGMAVALLILAASYALSAVIESFGVAGNLFRARLESVATVYPLWALKLSSIGIFIGCVASSVTILVRAVKAVPEPFQWALPVLSIVAGSSAEVSQELFPSALPLVKLAAGSILGMIFFLGGLFGLKKAISLKWRGYRYFLLCQEFFSPI
jgi:hypothetical protein